MKQKYFQKMRSSMDPFVRKSVSNSHLKKQQHFIPQRMHFVTITMKSYKNFRYFFSYDFFMCQFFHRLTKH